MSVNIISKKSWLFRGYPFESQGGAIQKAALLLLLILTAGVFDDKSGKNPIGMPYVLEASILILLSISMVIIVHAISVKQLKRIDFVIFLLVVGAWLLSAFNAYVWYGQPLIYGLIEDRRILLTLIYFPIVTLLRNRKLDAHDVIELLLVVAGLSIVLSIYFAATGSVNEAIYAAKLEARENRVSIGTHIVIIVTLLSFVFSMLKSSYKPYWLLWFFSSFGTLLFIVQTRKIILVLTVIIAVTLLRKRTATFILLATMFGVAGIMLWPILSDDYMMMKLLAIWGQLLDDDYLTTSARAHTVMSVFSELTNNYFLWGHGALSLLWNEGFHRVYGDNFYLADVGVVGILYRYGLPVTILILSVSIALAYVTTKRMMYSPLKRVMILGFFFVFLAPGAGVFFYAGLQFGILLGITVGLVSSNNRVHERMQASVRKL